MRVDDLRLQADRRPVMGDRHLVALQALAGLGHAEMRFRQIGRERQRIGEAFHRFGISIERRQRVATIAPRHNIAGVDRQRAVVAHEGFGVAAHRRLRIRHVDDRHFEIRIDGDSALKAHERFLCVAEAIQDHAGEVVRRRMVGPQFNQFE